MAGGRPKGTTNHQSKAIKDMVIASLDAVGGKAYFIKQATENPTAYMALVAKAMPKEVEMEIKRSLLEEVVDEQDPAHPANQE
jgi:hypothetical protein